MPPQDEPKPQRPIGIEVDSALARVAAFSDGIFAVAITILVWALAVPDLGSRPTDAALQARLVALLPSILSFVLSLTVVGLYLVEPSPAVPGGPSSGQERSVRSSPVMKAVLLAG